MLYLLFSLFLGIKILAFDCSTALTDKQQSPVQIAFLDNYEAVPESENVSHTWSYEEDLLLLQSLYSESNVSGRILHKNVTDFNKQSFPNITQKSQAQIKIRVQQLLCDRHPARLRQIIGPDIDKQFTCFPLDPDISTDLPPPEPKKVKKRGPEALPEHELTDEQKEILAYNPFDEVVPPCILITAAAGVYSIPILCTAQHPSSCPFSSIPLGFCHNRLICSP